MPPTSPRDDNRTSPPAAASGLVLGRSPVALPADFLAQLTHELKNHVAAAHAASFLLRSQGRSLAGEREQKWLDAIRQAVGALRGTLDQIDALEQVLTGATLPAEAIELVAWADAVSNRSTKAAPTTSVKVEIRALASGRWSFDAGLAGLALGCLVDNALKFGPPDSTAVVELRPEKDWLEVVVRDAGAGVPAAEVARLFDPFFQGVNSRDRGGSGLGLAISRSVATRLGGTLAYRRTPKSETEFCLRIPARRSQP